MSVSDQLLESISIKDIITDIKSTLDTYYGDITLSEKGTLFIQFNNPRSKVDDKSTIKKGMFILRLKGDKDSNGKVTYQLSANLTSKNFLNKTETINKIRAYLFRLSNKGMLDSVNSRIRYVLAYDLIFEFILGKIDSLRQENKDNKNE